MTIFILLGLLILLFAGFFAFVQQETTTVPSTPHFSETQIIAQNIVQSCFEPIAKEALFISSFQGGYLEVDDTAEEVDQRQINYYYYYKDISPNITSIYQLLEAYILTNTISCIEQSPLFTNLNMSIDRDAAFVSFFSETETTIQMELPITIVTDGTTESVSQFTTTIPIAFEKMYAVARQIVQEVEKSDPLTCMSCIHELAQSFGMTISVNDYEQTADYYVLYDPNSVIYDVPLAFAFAVQAQQDFDPTSRLYAEKSISLDLPSYNATVGEPFFLNINTEEFLHKIIPEILADPTYTLHFADFSPLFTIDPELGIITFTPTEQQRGAHTAIIKITDSKGQVEYTSFQVIIT